MKHDSDMPKAPPRRRVLPPLVLSQDELTEMLAKKVPFSSRITMAAQRELAALSREKRIATVDLLARALNLLFEAEGRKPVA